MKTEHWQDIEEWLMAALEIEPAERSKFLDEAGVSELVRGEVEALLKYEHQADGLMAVPAVAFSAEFFAQRDTQRAGQTVGQYRIIHEIGRGGMGTVFLAERADGIFQQQVALKVIRQTLTDSEIERGFKRERQILASLNHYNIARLFDGGVSADGEPFFVMEFVAGSQLLEYAERNGLGITDRLKLFLKVCSAVAYAHRNLVVHRDLKPSNILVTDDGEPKLLDFGLAKILDDNALNESSHTATAFRAMTPAYASPEQIAGQTITTVSDVYSLGVVLYELLTGVRPYQFKSNRLDEIIRTINDTAPARPSSRFNPSSRAEEVRDDSNGESTGGKSRRTSESAIVNNLSGLKGDLDNIVLMALRKEPERRYESVEAFAGDIERHLNGVPVIARSNTLRYRASKFVGRNRVAVVATFLVAIALVAGFAIALWQAGVAREKARIAAENQQQADESRVRAERETRRSEKILGFMERVLSYANPNWYAEGGQVRGQARLIDVLNEMGGKIEAEFPDDLDIQAELHHKCAEIFLANQMVDRAAVHAQSALRLRQKVFGQRHPEVAKDLYYLGSIEAAQGKILEHRKLLQQAAAIFYELAPENANLPYLLEDLASTESYIFGNTVEAEKLFTQSLELFRRKDGDGHRNTARLYFDLSLNAARKGETERSGQFFSEGEKRILSLADADSQLQIPFARGSLEFALGHPANARAILEQLMVDARKLKGEEREVEKFVGGYLLGVYEQEKDWKKAVTVARGRVEATRRLTAADSMIGIQELAQWSVYLARAGQRAEARSVYEECRAILLKSGADTDGTVSAKIRLAECLLVLGRRAEALALLKPAYEFCKTNFPPTHRDRKLLERIFEEFGLEPMLES